ncbi:tyrosine-type recombinase/integrase [Ottowia thiooxydans]|uniref:Integrase n=1 Tax=Ottowia thiooxydans TaxID=219182 RepID=A0ABV2Q770_9BURK
MTRYPRSGKGRRWTILELRAISPDWAGDTLADGDGLVGEVRIARDKAVSLVFRCAFRWEGKLTWHYCGTWPAKSMEAIRDERDKARGLVKRGVDPRAEKIATRIEAQAKVQATIRHAEQERAQDLPLSAMFTAWVTDGVTRANGNADLKRAFEKDILPAVGAKPVRNITETDLREALRKVGRGRGRGRTAEVLLDNLRQLFNWAEQRQPWRGLLVECNPAELVKLDQIVNDDYDPDPRDRVLQPAEVCELRDIFAQMKVDYEGSENRRSAPRPVQNQTQLALWICLFTLCRIGELLMARWEHIDLNTGTWFIPKEHVKGRRGKKTDHYIFLSAGAKRQFEVLRELTGQSPWCFPARNVKSEPTHVCVKSVSKQVGDRQERFKERTKKLKNRRQDNTLVLARGERGEWTPHDLRRTGATWMQGLGVTLDIIDRCQNHVLAGSKVRRHYLHHDYAEEKREAWKKLGERIELILEGRFHLSPGLALRS